MPPKTTPAIRSRPKSSSNASQSASKRTRSNNLSASSAVEEEDADSGDIEEESVEVEEIKSDRFTRGQMKQIEMKVTDTFMDEKMGPGSTYAGMQKWELKKLSDLLGLTDEFQENAERYDYGTVLKQCEIRARRNGESFEEWCSTMVERFDNRKILLKDMEDAKTVVLAKQKESNSNSNAEQLSQAESNNSFPFPLAQSTRTISSSQSIVSSITAPSTISVKTLKRIEELKEDLKRRNQLLEEKQATYNSKIITPKVGIQSFLPSSNSIPEQNRVYTRLCLGPVCNSMNQPTGIGENNSYCDNCCKFFEQYHNNQVVKNLQTSNLVSTPSTNFSVSQSISNNSSQFGYTNHNSNDLLSSSFLSDSLGYRNIDPDLVRSTKDGKLNTTDLDLFQFTRNSCDSNAYYRELSKSEKENFLISVPGLLMDILINGIGSAYITEENGSWNPIRASHFLGFISLGSAIALKYGNLALLNFIKRISMKLNSTLNIVQLFDCIKYPDIIRHYNANNLNQLRNITASFSANNYYLNSASRASSYNKKLTDRESRFPTWIPKTTGFCFYYNAETCNSTSCKYSHQCIFCKTESHPASQCKSEAAIEAKKKGK